MVTLAGLEPATSPAPVNKDALSPLSYSVVTIFMTVCGGAGAWDRRTDEGGLWNTPASKGLGPLGSAVFYA
jgi:hypothetical protein